MKYLITLFICGLSIFGFCQSQIKYSIVTDAGIQINVLADGTSDTVTTENVAPREYIALLTQSSTGAPSVSRIFKNDIGNIVWSYTSTGTYTGTFLGTTFTSFPSGRTTGFATLQARGSDPRHYVLGRATDSTVILSSMNSSFTLADPSGTNTILVHITAYY